MRLSGWTENLGKCPAFFGVQPQSCAKRRSRLLWSSVRHRFQNATWHLYYGVPYGIHLMRVQVRSMRRWNFGPSLSALGEASSRLLGRLLIGPAEWELGAWTTTRGTRIILRMGTLLSHRDHPRDVVTDHSDSALLTGARHHSMCHSGAEKAAFEVDVTWRGSNQVASGR